jgi:hypothetical protein
MTIYELKRRHLEKNPGSHWFDRDTLKFFGEALSRMEVLKKTVTVTDSLGEKHECYVVSATRAKDWNGPSKPYVYHHYFDVDTLEGVSVNREED